MRLRKRPMGFLYGLGALLLVFAVGCGQQQPAPTAPAAAPAAPAPAAPSPAPKAPAAPAAAPKAPAAPAPAPKAPAAPAFDAEKYFAGKKITLTLPSAAGSNVDTSARVLAPIWGRNIPGKPNIVVENRPGAGGVTGLNHFYKTGKPDGFDALMMAGPALRQVFAETSGAQADIRKLRIIGSLGDTIIHFASTKKLKSAKDVFGFKNGKLFPGYRGMASANTISQLSQLEVAGANYEGVLYGGAGTEGRVAVLRGEADLWSEASLGYAKSVKPEVGKGLLVPLWQQGLLDGDNIVRDQRVKDIPTFLEVYKSVTGKELSGEALEVDKAMAAERLVFQTLALPPGTPNHIVDVMSAALLKAMKDPEFEKTTKVDGIPMKASDAKAATAANNRIVNLPKPLIKRHEDLWKKAGLD